MHMQCTMDSYDDYQFNDAFSLNSSESYQPFSQRPETYILPVLFAPFYATTLSHDKIQLRHEPCTMDSYEDYPFNDTFSLNSSESYQPYSQRPETYIVPVLFALFYTNTLSHDKVQLRHEPCTMDSYEDYPFNDTFSFNSSESYQPYSQRPETYIVPVLFALIFLIGVIGNGTLVAVFVRHKAMRNVPNTYILSLALADLLVIITCVPFTSIVYTVESWPWGAAVCQLSEAAKDISIGVSVFTLTALSADRYFAIVDPLRKLHATGGSKRATRLTVTTAVGIWVLAALLATPAYLGSYVRAFVVNPTTQFLVCYPYPIEWGEDYPRLMVLIRFLVYYSLPLAVIAMFYILMARHLVLSTQNMPGEMQGTQRQMRARKKVALTVLAFVVVFAACFLPSHVFMMWFYYCPTAQEDYNGWWHALRIIGFCLSFLNSCVNPIALYCTSGIFRKHFNRYLLCRGVPTHGRGSFSVSTSRRLTSSRKTNISMVQRSSVAGRSSSVRLTSNGSSKL